jgi:hypothetical protein
LHETDRSTIRQIVDSLSARRNLLDNGTFRVWQRGASPTVVDNGYGPDRWRLLLEAASAAAVAQDTSDVPTTGGKSAAKLTVGSGEDNKFGLWQIIEGLNVKHLRGQPVSLQAQIKATAAITDVRMAVVEWTGTEDAVSSDPISSWGTAGTNPTLAATYAYLGTPANLSPTTSWATYRVEGLTVGASANNLAVLIWCEDETTTVTTDVLRIADVQLEEGALCTDVAVIPYADDLARCQRHYLRLNSIGNTVILSFCGFSSTTLARFPLVMPVTMRANPTGAVSGASDLQVTVDFSTTATGTIGFSATGPNQVALSISSLTSSFTVGNAGFVRWVGGSSWIELSADL